MEPEDVVAVPLILLIGGVVILSIQGYDIDFLINIFDEVVILALILGFLVAISRSLVT